MSKDGCIVDMVIDNGDYSNREVKNAVQSIIQEPSSTGQIQGAHRVHGHQTIKSNSDKNKNSNCIVVKIDEIMGEGKDQPAKSSPSNYRLSSRCSLCMRFYQSTELTNGHLVKGPYSKNPLSKVLVMAVQSTLKLPRMNWLICNSCVDTLREADENLHELSKIQRKLTIMKKGLISMINPDVTGKVGDFTSSIQQKTELIYADDCTIVENQDTTTFRISQQKSVSKVKTNVENQETTTSMVSKQKSVSKVKTTIENQEKSVSEVKTNDNSFLNSPKSNSEVKDITSCPLCQRDMKKRSLKVHIPYFHKKKIPITCRVCLMKLPNEAVFADHLVARHANVTNLQVVASARELEECVTKRRKPKHPCPKCHKLLRKRSVVKHMRVIHNVEIKCSLCAEVFEKITQRVQHMIEVHGYGHKRKTEELATCPYCDKNFRGGKHKLKNHIRNVHLNNEKVIKLSTDCTPKPPSPSEPHMQERNSSDDEYEVIEDTTDAEDSSHVASVAEVNSPVRDSGPPVYSFGVKHL